METQTLDQRQQFIDALESGHWSMSELCALFGGSRPTGYKWVTRYRAGCRAALADRSHAPHHCPHRTGGQQEALILAVRREYGWGAKKLRAVLHRRYPAFEWPARSTINDLLSRHQLLRRHRRRRPWTHPGSAPLTTTHPNQVWPADLKGEFQTGDGRYCYPLTVTDYYSRVLLVCQALPSIRGTGVQPVFRTLFGTVGLPEAIRTDYGSPFASPAIHGLSAPNVWCDATRDCPSTDCAGESARDRDPRAQVPGLAREQSGPRSGATRSPPRRRC